MLHAATITLSPLRQYLFAIYVLDIVAIAASFLFILTSHRLADSFYA